MNRVLLIIALSLLAIVGGPVATVCILYLLPSIVAHLIHRPHRRRIMLVNVAVGWTLLGGTASNRSGLGPPQHNEPSPYRGSPGMPAASNKEYSELTL